LTREASRLAIERRAVNGGKWREGRVGGIKEEKAEISSSLNFEI
jgi:hypothetical protein